MARQRRLLKRFRLPKQQTGSTVEIMINRIIKTLRLYYVMAVSRSTPTDESMCTLYWLTA